MKTLVIFIALVIVGGIVTGIIVYRRKKEIINAWLRRASIYNNEVLWFAFIGFLLISSIPIGVAGWWLINGLAQLTSFAAKSLDNQISWSPNFWCGIVFSLLYIAIFLYRAIKAGWKNIPQNWVYLIEVFGAYRKKAGTGLYVIFPYFGFVTYVKAYLGQQQFKLFMDEQHKSDVGGGDVEFRDASAPVEATVYYQIMDQEPDKDENDIDCTEKAVYNINAGSPEKGLEEKLDSAVRSFLGQYDIDEANVIKARTNLANIMNGDFIKPPKDADPKNYTAQELHRSTPEEVKTKLESCALYKEILEQWGIKVIALAISDIVLSKEEKEARRKVLTARKEEEASKHTMQALRNLGVGYSAQVTDLGSAGVDPNHAVDYLQNRLKWEKVGDKTVIIDSGQGLIGLGAQFAAGHSAFNQSMEQRSTPDSSPEPSEPAPETTENQGAEQPPEQTTGG